MNDFTIPLERIDLNQYNVSNLTDFDHIYAQSIGKDYILRRKKYVEYKESDSMIERKKRKKYVGYRKNNSILKRRRKKHVECIKSNSLLEVSSRWTVKETSRYIAEITDRFIGKIFEINEIDGKSLRLINIEDMIGMHIKLGPALIIFDKISKL